MVHVRETGLPNAGAQVQFRDFPNTRVEMLLTQVVLREQCLSFWSCSEKNCSHSMELGWAVQ